MTGLDHELAQVTRRVSEDGIPKPREIPTSLTRRVTFRKLEAYATPIVSDCLGWSEQNLSRRGWVGVSNASLHPRRSRHFTPMFRDI